MLRVLLLLALVESCGAWWFRREQMPDTGVQGQLDEVMRLYGGPQGRLISSVRKLNPDAYLEVTKLMDAWQEKATEEGQTRFPF